MLSLPVLHNEYSIFYSFRKRSRSKDRSKSKSPSKYGEGAIRIKDEPLDKVLCKIIHEKQTSFRTDVKGVYLYFHVKTSAMNVLQDSAFQNEVVTVS